MTDKSLEEKFDTKFSEWMTRQKNPSDRTWLFTELSKIAHSHYQKEEKVTQGGGYELILERLDRLEANVFPFEKRPTQKKSLAEKLLTAFNSSWESGFFTPFSESGDDLKKAWNRVADKAREAMLGGKEVGLHSVVIDCISRKLNSKDITDKILDYLKKES